MQDASETMAVRGVELELIVQGGAVKVLLGDRQRTSDMDFIATSYVSGPGYSETLDNLKRGWKFAYTQSLDRSEAIDSKWVDNSIQFFFHGKPKLWQKYKSETLKQNYVLSDAGIDEDDGTGIRFIL
ncbi:hypothetical protein NUU61_001824 [Penicillium alfredii]|uniref:Uncharacterized protein n=1 Tax=Penicillium alfredii TaxID=1506179 RepID=A0A9W9KGQ1_9EURO|nr:uncharacterized protein NUU61_001824 [Penicillium alfredii]KAJ5104477.1 hypothetical protein NUU61_001824 [Penicillium alfredii]